MADTAVATETPAPATPAKKQARQAGGAKKPKAKPTHPKTSEMVNNAILEMKERSGSSLQAIKKYISAQYKVDAEKLAPFIRKYLKSAVESGTLIQTKGKGASGSFKLESKSAAAKKPSGGAGKAAGKRASTSAGSKTKKATASAAGAKTKKAAAASASASASSGSPSKSKSASAGASAKDKKAAAAAKKKPAAKKSAAPAKSKGGAAPKAKKTAKPPTKKPKAPKPKKAAATPKSKPAAKKAAAKK